MKVEAVTVTTDAYLTCDKHKNGKSCVGPVTSGTVTVAGDADEIHSEPRRRDMCGRGWIELDDGIDRLTKPITRKRRPSTEGPDDAGIKPKEG